MWDGNDARVPTVGAYLVKLLAMVWDDGEGFNSKRPFGNSGWDWDLLIALGEAGHIVGTKDEDGCWDFDDANADRGRELIAEAIQSLWTAP